MTGDIWQQIFNYDNYGELLFLVRNSLVAGAMLGLVGGIIGTFVMMRDLAFAVHGVAELSFAGASAALLIGVNVAAGSLAGSIVAALIIGALGVRARDRNSIIGVLMPFGLGLGVLFLALYKGRAANKFGLLTGQIVAVDTVQMTWLISTCVVVLTGLCVLWRPLTFASLDPEVAAARGVPVRVLSSLFMVLLGLSVAVSIQVVGALLVLALLVTPAAAAMRVSASPGLVTLLSVVFALTSMLGGILLALGSSIPISPYVTTISFTIYVVCRGVGVLRTRVGSRGPHRPRRTWHRLSIPDRLHHRGSGTAEAPYSNTIGVGSNDEPGAALSGARAVHGDDHVPVRGRLSLLRWRWVIRRNDHF